MDVCQKRFDVVLMNPPFGALSILSEDYISKSYPNYGGDVITAFITRAISWVPSGLIGAITSRTAFYLPTYANWRQETFFGPRWLSLWPILGQMCLTVLWSRLFFL